MKNKKGLRIFLDVLLFVSVFLLPWYVTLFIAIILLFLFRAYEIIIAGFIMDALYGTRLYDVEFLFTLGFLALYFISQFMKKNLLLYS